MQENSGGLYWTILPQADGNSEIPQKEGQLDFFIQCFILFFNALFSHIFQNCIFITKLIDSIYKVAICPRFFSPQLLFYFWMQTKEFSCSDTFYYCHYFGLYIETDGIKNENDYYLSPSLENKFDIFLKFQCTCLWEFYKRPRLKLLVYI